VVSTYTFIPCTHSIPVRHHVPHSYQKSEISFQTFPSSNMTSVPTETLHPDQDALAHIGRQLVTWARCRAIFNEVCWMPHTAVTYVRSYFLHIWIVLSSFDGMHVTSYLRNRYVPTCLRGLIGQAEQSLFHSCRRSSGMCGRSNS